MGGGDGAAVDPSGVGVGEPGPVAAATGSAVASGDESGLVMGSTLESLLQPARTNTANAKIEPARRNFKHTS